ncbi:heterokaryon incompatibility protein s [Xylariaceae sp. FL1651]|nr:heterokaryon incompatibility protein s [Xylariaceae sp. FL1651]
MAETFGVVAGALSVAALFNNCVGCFEYIQFGRHFAEDFERCQLKVDVARTRLSRWGQAVAINHDLRFATASPDDKSVQQVQDILEQIDELFQSLNRASKRYARRAEKNDIESLQVQSMQPVAQKLHRRLGVIVAQRQKGTSFIKKAAWALYDRKNFEKLVNEMTGFIDNLEKLYPAREGARRKLVQMEIEEVDDEPSLDALQKAAENTDSVLSEGVANKLKTYGGRNYARVILSEAEGRVRVGNEWTEAALSSGFGQPGQEWNEAGSVTARGSSTVQIGNSYGGRGI